MVADAGAVATATVVLPGVPTLGGSFDPLVVAAVLAAIELEPWPPRPPEEQLNERSMVVAASGAKIGRRVDLTRTPQATVNFARTSCRVS